MRSLGSSTPYHNIEAVNKEGAELDLALDEWTGTTPQGVAALPIQPEKKERGLPRGVTINRGSLRRQAGHSPSAYGCLLHQTQQDEPLPGHLLA